MTKIPHMIARTDKSVLYTIGGHPDHTTRVRVTGLGGVVVLVCDLLPGGSLDLEMFPPTGSFDVQCEWTEEPA